MIVKDTLKLQLASLIDFANVLGFYLTQNERGHKFFEDKRGFKVSMNHMIGYHNGNVRGCHTFHTFQDVARSLSNILCTEFTANQVEVAYNSRRCYTFKYRYNKKTAKFIGSQYDNVVKLLPGVTL
ncbi:hypothetical protein FDJ19_gp133 [Vibrio phage Ceto]|uniref:DUF7390 domain-containing protein n=1 Tax=Vibrio phage Ceto TaxID=2570300 RepID=A0A2H5BGQ0_9CAUD|nr:hypothetical protein FDJ19_gp133 [Vibrio phage Ceto]AUG85165.1 hypothetical protein CETO_183 [Vibrio phage Ceto]